MSKRAFGCSSCSHLHGMLVMLGLVNIMVLMVVMGVMVVYGNRAKPWLLIYEDISSEGISLDYGR